MIYDATSAVEAIFDLGKSAIERIWPDPIQRAKELRKLEKIKVDGDIEKLRAHVQLMLGQMEINKVEAAHKSVFVAGWRPLIGWVGGFSLAYSGIIHPLLIWLWTVNQAFGNIPADIAAPPFIESTTLGTIVTGMLGVGAMRSHDKRHGVQTDRIRSKP